MFYKPKYCCNCGEKIERIDWNALTSRRFCDPCSLENKRYDYVSRTLIASGALGLMFGFGSLFGSAGVGNDALNSGATAPAAFRQQLPERAVEKNAAALETSPHSHSALTQAETATAAAPPGPASKQTIGTQYFCGALTKKGTPCSRKVKASGTRCFQHEGKSTAPPQNQ